MKRWMVWSFVSLATFFVGTLFVFAYLIATAPEYVAKRIAAPQTEKILSAPTEPNFIPEFRDLPDFDDFVYRPKRAKLIHFLGDGIFRRSEVVAANGERWFVVTKNRGFDLTEH
jgi:hypothetical protein